MEIADRVVRRFLAFRYQPKESKQSKVERLLKRIREATGISKSMAEDIADAIVRRRDVPRLTLQKNWPIVDGVVEGPSGQLQLSRLS